ncbi:hypothetical protein [Rhizobium sp. EC-SD404]|uniref:hypothetical protein n=1 Tax=Rhizobium sp. EC-SD404 TaxID=2038389 RepID=UPI001254D56B|nr:hypothetical protein [Rhizobium sp. EC-SD404]VVT30225.1 conserved hypothetical protein [Rhizobium sp. EC-SD404]
MRKRRHEGLIVGLRSEISLFARVALLVLALPFLQPFVEAHAAAGETSGVICTVHGPFDPAEATDGDGASSAIDHCVCTALCALTAMPEPSQPEIGRIGQPQAAGSAAPLSVTVFPGPDRSFGPPGQGPPFSI